MAVRYGSIGVATTRTVPPAPAAGGGDPWATWVDVPATAAGFVVHQATGWSVTNPTADTLRVTSTSTGTARNWTPSVQDGLVMIWPQAQNPFPVTTPTGLTGPPWDSEHAMFKMRAKVVKGSLGASPNGIHGGVGLVTYTNDQAAAPAAPPFSNTAGQPSWWFNIQMTDRNLGNNSWNPSWGSSGNGWYSTTPPSLPPYGDVGQANQVEIATTLGGRHADFNECVSCFWSDTRTPATGPQYQNVRDYIGGNPNDLKMDQKYLYPALFVANYNTAIQIGDWFEFSDIQIQVQQIRGRDS